MGSLRSCASVRQRLIFFSHHYLFNGLLLLLLCAGCGEGVASTSHAVPKILTPPADLLTAHVLTIGSYTNYLPQEYVDTTTHTVAGFDIDLLQAMAQRMHLRLVIVNDDFSSLIPDLVSKRFDAVVSAVSITSDLEKQVDFIPYFKGGESLLVSNENPLHIQNLSDLCGQKVAVKDGSFEQSDLQAASNLCQSHGKQPVSIVAKVQYTDLLQLLSTSAVVAIYQDAPLNDYAIKQFPQHFSLAGPMMDSNIEGIAVRKNDPSMYHALNVAFAAVRADGTYHAIILHWGLTSGEMKP